MLRTYFLAESGKQLLYRTGLRGAVARAPAADALEQMVHASVRGWSDIGFKMQLGNAKKVQPFRQLAAQEMAGTLERMNGFLLLLRPSVQMQTHLRVPHVGRNQDFCYRGVSNPGI